MLCLSGVFFCPPPVMSGDFSTTIDIMARQIYNDNIHLTDENPGIRMKRTATGTVPPQTRTKQSGFIATVSPRITIGYDAPRTSAKVSARLLFSDLDESDDVDQFYDGSFGYQLTPYTRLTMDGGYSRDSDPGSEIDTTGRSYSVTTVRDRHNYGAGLESNLSEISLVRLNYGYRQSDYSTPRLRANNFKSHSLSVSYTRDTGEILERSYVYTNTRFMNYKTINTEQNNVSLVLGAGYQLSEAFSLRAGAGISYSHETFNDTRVRLLSPPPFPYPHELVRFEQSQQEWSPAGNIQLDYQGEWTKTSLKYSYDVQPASGRGTMARLTEVRLDVSRRLGEFLTIRGFSSYFLYKRDGILDPPPLADAAALAWHNNWSSPLLRRDKRHGLDEKTLNLGLEASYTFNRHFSLTGNYTHTRKKQEIDRGNHWQLSDAKQNRFFIRLNYRYSFE